MWLPRSLTYTSPLDPTAIPHGLLNDAAVPKPSRVSPLPSPAMTVMSPPGDSVQRRWFPESVRKSVPIMSVVIAQGRERLPKTLDTDPFRDTLRIDLPS